MGSQLISLLMLSLLFSLTTISNASRPIPDYYSHDAIKTVNLGGWLVTEGWITPHLFDDIPINKDLLDGTQIQLKSITLKNYLSANNGGGSTVSANQPAASTWETFKLWRITETSFQFRVLNWQFFSLDDNGKLVATSTASDDSNSLHNFMILRNDGEPNRVRIKAPNGSFLKVNSDATVTADHPERTSWGDDDPSVFLLTNVLQLKGEFQVTNAYGSDSAASVMKKHWESFIVEEDFKFVSENGLNGVRIPVGWWISFDPNPPRPFVGGSLHALDNAFSWAEKYNLKVIIDIHAMPSSQNGWEHSGTRDGLQSWGQSYDDIRQSTAVVDFLTSRYANRTSLYAIELINEPLAPGVTLDTLKKYYRVGYNTVRKYSNVHVIMSNRLSIGDPKELIQFASGFSGSVVDVHYYNVFSSIFEGMSVQQNIDYIYNNRAPALSSLMISNGPLIFVGEWVDDMDVQDASKNDYQRFGSAQLDVYGRATFGWSYWTLKADQNQWSLEWMIKNGYIKI
ncbi:glucan 1,3-beta-glucosidase A-like [Phalaenopsis equestris]|uniref:glucan 1,3-beta-glucosidase A-like n=1 Tax=Phalaenopsis equestris TaxID=78828 RepID=UPI0009E2BE49|nr:glucan 1,3-beta-glucosidase A-like [Phalaenopsis equestris]